MESEKIAQAIKAAKELRKAHKLVTHDRYKEMKAPKECKGIDSRGEEIIGYVYNPDYFVKSDVSGKMCRFYIVVNDVIMHPDELDKVSIVAGVVKIAQRECITIGWPTGNDRVYSFDMALSDVAYTYSHAGPNPSVTLTHAGRSFTKSQKEWIEVRDKIKIWVPRQGDKVFETFQEWADKQS